MGVALLASRNRLDALFGSPTGIENLRADIWRLDYHGKGLAVVYGPRGGVLEIHLARRDAGDIGGVRIGDTKNAVLARWGAPSDTELTSVGPEAAYIAGEWQVIIL